MDEWIVRRRTPKDVPVLLEILAAQQERSGYPQTVGELVEDFVDRRIELAAFVAEMDGEIAGHISVMPPYGIDERTDAQFQEVWASGHGRPVSELCVLSALFIAPWARGRGIGMNLLQQGIAWGREQDLAPCLAIAPNKTGAVDAYLTRGWIIVGELRPQWLAPGNDNVLAMILPQRPS